MESDNGDKTTQVSQFCTSFRYYRRFLEHVLYKTQKN